MRKRKEEFVAMEKSRNAFVENIRTSLEPSEVDLKRVAEAKCIVEEFYYLKSYTKEMELFITEKEAELEKTRLRRDASNRELALMSELLKLKRAEVAEDAQRADMHRLWLEEEKEKKENRDAQKEDVDEFFMSVFVKAIEHTDDHYDIPEGADPEEVLKKAMEWTEFLKWAKVQKKEYKASSKRIEAAKKKTANLTKLVAWVHEVSLKEEEEYLRLLTAAKTDQTQQSKVTADGGFKDPNHFLPGGLKRASSKTGSKEPGPQGKEKDEADGQAAAVDKEATSSKGQSGGKGPQGQQKSPKKPIATLEGKKPGPGKTSKSPKGNQHQQMPEKTAAEVPLGPKAEKQGQGKPKSPGAGVGKAGPQGQGQKSPGRKQQQQQAKQQSNVNDGQAKPLQKSPQGQTKPKSPGAKVQPKEGKVAAGGIDSGKKSPGGLLKEGQKSLQGKPASPAAAGTERKSPSSSKQPNQPGGNGKPVKADPKPSVSPKKQQEVKTSPKPLEKSPGGKVKAAKSPAKSPAGTPGGQNVGKKGLQLVKSPNKPVKQPADIQQQPKLTSAGKSPTGSRPSTHDGPRSKKSPNPKQPASPTKLEGKGKSDLASGSPQGALPGGTTAEAAGSSNSAKGPSAPKTPKQVRRPSPVIADAFERELFPTARSGGVGKEQPNKQQVQREQQQEKRQETEQQVKQLEKEQQKVMQQRKTELRKQQVVQQQGKEPKKSDKKSPLQQGQQLQKTDNAGGGKEQQNKQKELGQKKQHQMQSKPSVSPPPNGQKKTKKSAGPAGEACDKIAGAMRGGKSPKLGLQTSTSPGAGKSGQAVLQQQPKVIRSPYFPGADDGDEVQLVSKPPRVPPKSPGPNRPAAQQQLTKKQGQPAKNIEGDDLAKNKKIKGDDLAKNKNINKGEDAGKSPRMPRKRRADADFDFDLGLPPKSPKPNASAKQSAGNHQQVQQKLPPKSPKVAGMGNSTQKPAGRPKMSEDFDFLLDDPVPKSPMKKKQDTSIFSQQSSSHDSPGINVGESILSGIEAGMSLPDMPDFGEMMSLPSDMPEMNDVDSLPELPAAVGNLDLDNIGNLDDLVSLDF